MNLQQLAILFLYSIVLFIAAKVLIAWVQGGINTYSAWEWFLRGFFISLGFMSSFLFIVLIMKFMGVFK